MFLAVPASLSAPLALSPRAILSMRSTLLPASSAEPALVFALPDLSPRVDSDTDQKSLFKTTEDEHTCARLLFLLFIMRKRSKSLIAPPSLFRWQIFRISLQISELGILRKPGKFNCTYRTISLLGNIYF